MHDFKYQTPLYQKSTKDIPQTLVINAHFLLFKNSLNLTHINILN